MERGNLYLRFDKQSAFCGQFKFTQNDPIHVKIHFKNKTSEQIADFCKSSGMLP
jgi:RNA binding exosome subunit